MRSNGALLNKYLNKNVSVIGKVQSMLPNNTSFSIETSDKCNVTVNLKQPITEHISGLVEVHGIAQSSTSINCDYYLMFPYELANTYDASLDNEAVNLSYHIPNSWR